MIEAGEANFFNHNYGRAKEQLQVCSDLIYDNFQLIASLSLQRMEFTYGSVYYAEKNYQEAYKHYKSCAQSCAISPESKQITQSCAIMMENLLMNLGQEDQEECKKLINQLKSVS